MTNIQNNRSDINQNILDISANSSAITNLAGGAPDLLNTLNELSNALGNDANFSTTVLDRLSTNETAIKSVFSPGMIMMWSGDINNIPVGWALCDGSNNTPDLRGKFVLGASGNVYATGATGGEEKVTLTTDEMPRHRHSVAIRGNADGFNRGDGFATTDRRQPGHPTNLELNHDTEYTGLGKAHNNMPPYYVLAYIIKL